MTPHDLIEALIEKNTEWWKTQSHCQGEMKELGVPDDADATQVSMGDLRAIEKALRSAGRDGDGLLGIAEAMAATGASATHVVELIRASRVSPLAKVFEPSESEVEEFVSGGSNPQTETPRTDAALADAKSWLCSVPVPFMEFARQLERELSGAGRNIVVLNDLIRVLKDSRSTVAKCEAGCPTCGALPTGGVGETKGSQMTENDVVRWLNHAETLLLQFVPTDHDGKNTWLLNMGLSEEAHRQRVEWNQRVEKAGGHMKIDSKTASGREKLLALVRSASAIICGSNDAGVAPEITGGCGAAIQDDVYRCADCGVPFHHAHIKRHFGECSLSASETGKDKP